MISCTCEDDRGQKRRRVNKLLGGIGPTLRCCITPIFLALLTSVLGMLNSLMVEEEECYMLQPVNKSDRMCHVALELPMRVTMRS